MKKIIDLMKADLITMNGGENSLRSVAVLIIIFCVGGGYCISPLAGVCCPFLMGTFLVPMLFENEVKYHSEKLLGLLPIKRCDLVSARFLLVMGLYAASGILFYLLMLPSLIFKPYYLFFEEDAGQLDIISLAVRATGGVLTEYGVFGLAYFTCFAVGMIIAAGSLRSYFKDSEKFDTSSDLNGRPQKKYYIHALIAAAVMMLLFLTVSGILPLGSSALVIIQLLLQLAEAGNGFLLGAVFVAVAVFSAVYKYICTLLEYEEKEL